MKVKNSRKKILMITFLIVFIFFTFITINSIRTKRINDKKSDYLLPIFFLIMDQDKVDSNISISDASRSKYKLGYANVSVSLVKKGSYYEGNLNGINELLLKKMKNYVFSFNNPHGQVIDNAKFDKKNNIIKVPKEYYSKKKTKSPIQMQILSMINKNKYKKVSISVNYRNLLNHKKISYVDATDTETSVALYNYNKNSIIDKKNLSVYINGFSNKLSKESYDFDSKSGVLTIHINPLLISKIDVIKNNKINNFLSHLFALKDVNALKYDKMSKYYKKINGVTAQSDGFTYKGKSIKMNFHVNYITEANKEATWAGTDGAAKKKAYNKGYDLVCNKSGDCGDDAAAYHPFILKMKDITFSHSYTESGTTKTKNFKIDFTGTFYINLYCDAHNETISDAEGSEIETTVKVLEYAPAKNYIVLQFDTDQKISTQSGYGVIKFVWDSDDQARIHVEKHWYNGSTDTNSKIEGVKVGLYDDASCTDKIQSKKTNSNGNVNFTELNLGEDYYVKEIAMPDGYAASWTMDSGCHKVNTTKASAASTETGDDGETIYVFNSDNLNNRKRYYCLAFTKVDAESGTSLNGFTFSNPSLGTNLTGGGLYHNTNATLSASSTPGTGVVMIDMLESPGTYSFSETGTPTNYCNDQTSLSSNGVSSVSTTEMSYNSSTGKYTCSANAASYKQQDHLKYYCARVKKIDSVTNGALTGAQFSATLNGTAYTGYNSSGTANGDTNADGYYYFFTGTNSGTLTVSETKAPEGYAAATASKNVSTVQMPCGTTASEAISTKISHCNTAYSSATTTEFKDDKLVLNWYKVTEKSDTRANGAKFKVRISGGSNSGKYVKVSGTVAQKDASGVTKTCYKYSSLGANATDASEMTSMNTNTIPSGSTTATTTNGEACVIGLPALETGASYVVDETHPAAYHTFGTEVSKTIEAGTSYKAMSTANKFINQPTVFRFEKTVEDTDGTQEGTTKYTIIKDGKSVSMSLKEMTTEQLKLITFKIYDSSGNEMSFVLNSDGVYEYSGNTIDPPTGTASSELHLNDKRQIEVHHLPLGTYSIKEVDSSTCKIGSDKTGTAKFGNISNPTTMPTTAATCAGGNGSGGDCIGYYNPDYSQTSYHQFTITECSNDNANSSVCSTKGTVTQSLKNTPTEVTLTKKDFYGYDDAADIIDKDREKDSKESTVEFESDKERSDFDRIDFKVKDASGNYINFIYLGKHGDCSNDESYSIYRYVPGLSLPTGVSADTFNNTIGGVTQTLHACGGHIKVINLCRGNKYTFEEVKVPDDSVYVLENTDSTPTSICFEIPCSGTTTTTSTTHIINDKGTRVRFEKRDSKYNYLIPDETTTFQVYRCKKGDETCHPGDYTTVDEKTGKLVVNQEQIEAAGMKLMKFSPRAVIKDIAGKPIDEEDPEDEEHVLGVEVYNAMSDSDAQGKSVCGSSKSNCYEVDLHPYHGILVLRYLQSGYHYALIETLAPKNYTQPIGQKAETQFEVINTTVNVDEVDVPNKPTSILIRKYSDDGKLLPGAEFNIYRGTQKDENGNFVCDMNKSPMNQTMEGPMKFKTIRDGVYEYRPELTDSTIKTCSDTENGKCSGIPTNESTDLTYSAYEGTWAEWEETVTPEGKSIEIQEGEALIQYLEYGNCYIIEEVKAPEGYSLPEKEADRFSMVYISENDSYYHDTETDLINTPTPFTFYKFDEFNKLLDGAEFKLQKLDDNKKYHDVPVDLDKTGEDGTLYYKVNEEGTNYTMKTHNGSATVYFLRAGQYRIVETAPAPGKELTKNPNIATFFVDSNGNVYGNAVIVNKKKTEKIEVKPTASAELIVNIQTGQTVIRYGLIISLLTAGVFGLMIYKRKRK